MGWVNKEDILFFLNNWHEIEKFKFEGLSSNNPAHTEGVLDAIDSFIQQIKAMPCINEENLSKEHEHDYFLVSKTDEKCNSLGYGGQWEHFKHATLACKKCGEIKQIKVDLYTKTH